MILLPIPINFQEWVNIVSVVQEGSENMLRWAAIFFVIALIAALFGFTGIAAAAAGIAKILFFVFLIFFIVALIMGIFGSSKRKPKL